jgi:hypothetical protein
VDAVDGALSCFDHFQDKTLTDAPIVVVGSKVLAKGSIEIALREKTIADTELEGARQILPWVVAMNRQLASDTQRHGAIFLDLLPVMCPELTACHIVSSDGYPVLSNAAHYSRWGARMLAPEVAKLLTTPLR